MLKLGYNIKFAWQVLAQRGVEFVSYDDTMLMSYVLDAGRADHGVESLVRRHFSHELAAQDALLGSGKSRVTFDLHRDQQGRPSMRPGAPTRSCGCGSFCGRGLRSST